MSALPGSDYLLLRPTLIALGIGLLVVVAFYGATAHLAAEAEAEWRVVQSRLAAARERDRARHAWRVYGERFSAFQRRGVIANKPPVSQGEAVQLSAAEVGARLIRFESGAITPLTIGHPDVRAPVAGSDMVLHLELTHEGELLRFLDRLRATTPGILWVRHCAFERNHRDAFQPGGTNLTVRCEFTSLVVGTLPVPESTP